MSQPAAAIREREPAGLPTVLHEPWPGLSIGLVALGLLFHREIAAAVDTWIDSSAYNHCFLVIPIVLFLIWDRRAALHGATAAPAPFAALLLLPLAVAWLAAERLGVMEGRQLVAMSMAEVLLLALLGPRLWRAARCCICISWCRSAVS